MMKNDPATDESPLLKAPRDAEAPPPKRHGFDAGDASYALASFGAVVRPVSATMLVASFFVVTVRVETGSLVVYDDDPADSGLERVGKGAANAGVVVCALLAATLAVLALYKFRCTRILRGYMMLSSGLLLGLLGGVLVLASLEELGLEFADLASFGLCAYNGAVLGVLAIYEPAYLRFPKAATQAALVVVAVVMAWQLSHYPPVTSWCLLVALAAYDAFAVLAPCGPLRWLVQLMGETGEPLPGLLYEADLDGDGDGAGAGAGAPSSVKLGLGDFVFYSVLVSNAFSSHAASGAACFVATLLGLGVTFLLLALHRAPLPALPVSIAAGVASYVLVEYAVLPLAGALRAARALA